MECVAGVIFYALKMGCLLKMDKTPACLKWLVQQGFLPRELALFSGCSGEGFDLSENQSRWQPTIRISMLPILISLIP